MEFLDPKIQAYAEMHTSAEPDYLYDLNRYTHSSVMKPRMLSGHLQGRFLSLMSHIMKAEYILDIGTYTGYSALCLAEGLSKTGKLYTIDNNDEVLAVAEKYIEKSGMKEKINILKGDAQEIIIELNTKVPYWDIVWMDADKSNYINYYQLCIEHLKPGGLIMADNVLWSGKVLEEQIHSKDEDTAILKKFNKLILDDARLENILMPIRDGIMILRKKD